MRICFSLFNINELEETNHNINRFVLQECGNFTWRVSNCEELVGVFTGISAIFKTKWHKTFPRAG